MGKFSELCHALQERVYSIQYSTSNLNEFLNNMKIITKCFGLNEIKSDICLIEFLIVFQDSGFFLPTSVRSMYSKCHLGHCTVYHNKVRQLGYVTPLMTPVRLCFTGVTPFRGANLMCRNTPFRVHF